MSNFKSRKFTLALLFALTGGFALFSGHLAGSEYIMLVTSVLALYGGANVLDKKGVRITHE